MGKSTEPPTCRFCGQVHRGTCMDHEARGAISSQMGAADERQQRIAKATEVMSSVKPKAKKSTAARKDVRTEKRRGSSGAKGDTKQSGRAVAQLVETPVQPEVAGSSPASTAGTQAPSVDTLSPKRRGRPKVVDDRKAYLAQKARERRARRKSDQPDNEVS